MGDRISLQFKKRWKKDAFNLKDNEEKSVVLFSHWQGMGLKKRADEYLKELKKWNEKQKSSICYPLNRLEPQTVMIDFIRYITKDEERITSDLYLGFTENDGDNSDNGHFIIDLNK